MKPHSLRRALWLSNVALGAAVIGVLAWFMLEVRPKVAEAVDRADNYQPPELKKVFDGYKSKLQTGLMWTPEAPVSKDEIHAVILRADFAKKKHWIFVGPKPPEDQEDTGPVEAGPPPPQGLAAIGEVSAVFLNPPDRSTILFKFSGGKPLAFAIGDFVRVSEKETARFKITDIVEVRARVYEIKYAIYGSDPDKPEGEGSVTWDESVADDEYPPFLRPATAKTGAGVGKKPGEEGTGTDAAGGGTGGGAEEVEDGADEGDAESPADGVIEVGTTPAEDLTLKDLKPKVHRDPTNRSRRAVEFDRNTYDYFRGKNAKGIAETVKTSVAKENGRVIGLRITGFQKDAPADVFDVRRGDILVSINGRKVNSRADAINIAQSLSPDNLVTVVIDRNGKLVTYTVDPRDPRTKRKVRYFENLR
jgi:hypothetical protein